MRADIIKIIIDLTETVHAKLIIKPCRHNNIEKVHCRFKHSAYAPMLLTSIHPLELVLAYRRFWHRFFYSLASVLQFPRQFFPPGLSCTHRRSVCLSYMHTQASVHVHLHSLESLSPPSAVKYWEPRSTAFSSERQLCVWEREREPLWYQTLRQKELPRVGQD